MFDEIIKAFKPRLSVMDGTGFCKKAGGRQIVVLKQTSLHPGHDILNRYAPLRVVRV
jgi:hypothetical protein